MSCGSAWIVDHLNHNRLVPYGCIGELLIDGPSLACCYLDDTEKTSATFISNVPWRGSSCRLYKTGDLVRYLDNGNLQFIGRKDTQIKIRGQRVELAEIERHLNLNSKARDLAVEFVKFPNGRQMLVAFFCFIPTSNDDNAQVAMTDDLRRGYLEIEACIRAVLPQYMIPALYVTLGHIPVTVSGKLDRKKLRDMVLEMSSTTLEACHLTSTATFDVVETEAQRTMQLLWSKALFISASDIGKNSNFFTLGGDSIDVMRLASASHQGGYALTAADIFRNPLLSQMATIVAAKDPTKSILQPLSDPQPFALLTNKSLVTAALSQPDVDIDESLVEDAYPATPLQEGLIALSLRQDQAYVAHLIYKLDVNVDVERWSKAWMHVNRTNAILRTRIIYAEGHGSMQIVMRNPEPMETSTSLSEYQAISKTSRMGYGTPLSRHCIVDDLADGHRYFVHTIHHANFDGYTLGQLSEQASRFYHASGSATPSPPPFTRFIQYLQRTDDDRSRFFWQSQLQGTPSIELYSDQVAATAAQRERVMRKGLLVDITTRSERLTAAVTTATLVRAGWALTMSQYTDSNDVVFGTTLSGRSAPVPGLENICAPTLTTVPLRVCIDPTRQIVDFVSDLAAQATDMIPHEHYGLSKMRKLNPNAISFQSLLIIQPAEEEAFCAQLMQPVDGVWDQNGVISETGYHAQPLVIVCSMRKNGFDLKAVYDCAILSPELTEAMLDCFATTYGGHQASQASPIYRLVLLALRGGLACKPAPLA